MYNYVICHFCVDIIFFFIYIIRLGSINFVSPNTYPSENEHFVRHRGAAVSFLENKGFGWLLDNEIDDEDSKKPLL